MLRFVAINFVVASLFAATCLGPGYKTRRSRQKRRREGGGLRFTRIQYRGAHH